MILAMSIMDLGSLATIGGTLVALVVAAYPAYRWWISKKHKKWIVIQDIATAQPMDDSTPKFEAINIEYKVDNGSLAYPNRLTLLKGKILNVGDQDVVKEDFQSTLGIGFAGVAKCIEVKCHPSNQASNAKLSISPDSDGIDITFDILKPNDSIEFTALITTSQYDPTNITQSIEVQNGLKDTIVEKRQTVQPRRKTLGETEPVLIAAFCFAFCMFTTGPFVSLFKYTPAPKTVVFAAQNGDKYTATYQDSMVFVESVDQQGNATEQPVYFRSEFEQKFRPELLGSPPVQKKQSYAHDAIIYTALGLVLMVYIGCAVICVVAFMRLLRSYLWSR